MKKLLISSSVVAVLLLGCGGGSSTSSTIETGVGYYVDSAVEGVHYNCGSQHGKTAKNGAFIFEKGQKCIFSLGDLKLYEINASLLQDDIYILEDNLEVAQLLQTLDINGDAEDGITLVPETATVLKDNYIEEIPKDDAILEVILTDLKTRNSNYHGKVVSATEAKKHIEDTRKHLHDSGHRTQHDNTSHNNGSYDDNVNHNNSIHDNNTSHNNGSYDDNINHDNSIHDDNDVNPNNNTHKEK
jgi:hypothetical protein